MSNNSAFHGFPKETFAFLRELERNNDRKWFNDRRDTVERVLIAPAQAFVEALGTRAHRVYPQLVYDTRVNGTGSMFRINRDTRFSNDKSPYKTNLGFRFWLSEEARRAKRVGLYVHLDKSGIRVYGGAHRLSPDELIAFRERVAADQHASALRRILADLAKQGYELEAEQLSCVPRGYPVDHPSADLLVRKSLFALSPKIDPRMSQSAQLVGECLAHAAALQQLNAWFAKALPFPSLSAK